MADPGPPPGTELAAAAADERVDVLDDAGAVVGQATRAEVRAGNLWHRSVFVAVVDGADRVVVHQRAAWKDVWPSRWDLSFGGVLGAGEGWDEAAVRELAEEAGVAVAAADLIALGEGRYQDARVREVARLFVVRSDGPFTFPDGEVVADDRVPLDELPAWAAGREVVPDSRLLVLPPLLAWAGGVAADR